MVHNGPPAHFCAYVRDWLDMAYPGRWIEPEVLFYGRQDRQISYLWIFFFLGNLKKLMYRDVVTTQIDEVTHLHVACTSVDAMCTHSFHGSFKSMWLSSAAPYRRTPIAASNLDAQFPPQREPPELLRRRTCTRI
ncbi:uncharacterized protein TNCV_4564161 [Trichonephila clavipes]|nr:uncharacterized protein TNCV_4564161 [Trichonephila clavipes]